MVLAAVQWKYMIQLYFEERKCLEENRNLEVKYEEVVANSLNVMKKVANLCDLDWNEKIEEQIKSSKLKNMNYKWKENFSDHEKKALNLSLKKFLNRLNYI